MVCLVGLLAASSTFRYILHVESKNYLLQIEVLLGIILKNSLLRSHKSEV